VIQISQIQSPASVMQLPHRQVVHTPGSTNWYQHATGVDIGR